MFFINNSILKKMDVNMITIKDDYTIYQVDRFN